MWCDNCKNNYHCTCGRLNYFHVSSKEKLRQFIRENEPRPILMKVCEWIIDLPEERFDPPRVGITVKEALRIWGIRYERMYIRGEMAAGLPEFIERLRVRPMEERIQVVGYTATTFNLDILATPSGEYLGLTRLVPGAGPIPSEFVLLEKLATANHLASYEIDT